VKLTVVMSCIYLWYTGWN